MITQRLGHEPAFATTDWTGPAPAPERVIAARTPDGTAYLALWPEGAMHFAPPTTSSGRPRRWSA
ncbi:hypothetical protein OG729_23135 [Streptomyces sp. NBC_00210]